jgi:lipopolysaccharide transport system permease protein
MWIVEYKDLIKMLTISDLKIKYQSSALGFIWSMLNPLLMMLVLYVVFNNAFGQGKDFALYILIGIMTWRFFSSGTSEAMNSIVGKPNLVTKIFIPRQILVLSSMFSSFISSLLEFLVLFALLFIFGVKFTLFIALFPFIHLIYFILIYGIGLALASTYVYYRDLTQIWDVILQLGFFLSPIVYPLSAVPPDYIQLYVFNPITTIMLIYRDIMLYATIPSLILLVWVVLSAFVSIAIGSIIFNRLERRFAEEL